MTTTHLSLLIKQSIRSHCMSVPCYVTCFLLVTSFSPLYINMPPICSSFIDNFSITFYFSFLPPSPQREALCVRSWLSWNSQECLCIPSAGSLAFHTLTLAPKWLKHPRKWCFPFIFLLILCPLHCQRFSLWWPFLNLVIRWRLTSKRATPPTNSCPVLLWILHSPFSILVGPRQGSHTM